MLMRGATDDSDDMMKLQYTAPVPALDTCVASGDRERITLEDMF